MGAASGKLRGRDVCVLGAGIGGLAVAIALAGRGAHVTVLEQADALREVGAGLQISPNGAAVLAGLGLSGALGQHSLRATGVALRDGRDNGLVLRMDLARLAPDRGWHFIHRADLLTILADSARAAGVELRLLSRVARVDLSGPAPVLVMATGERRDTDLLIGADGLHSVVRGALTGRIAPFFTRQVAWRCVIDNDPGDSPVAEVHMGPGRHLVSYPLRGGRLRNIVAVEERNAWVDEGWSLRDDAVEMQRAFAGFSPRVRGWLDRAQDVGLWGLFRHPVTRLWGRALPSGAVAVMGDAAHPTLPFLAQGANMALEDAWVLAQALDTGDDDGAALARYGAARGPRTERIVAAANANARNYHLRGPLRAVAHLGLRAGGTLAPGLALRRFDWLYGHDVTAGGSVS